MKNQQGLSLIELMIAMTLGIVLMTGVIQMFLTSRATYTSQQGVSQVQETGRLAVDFLTRDLRMAGYMGCSSRSPRVVNGLDASANYLYGYAPDFNVPMRAFESSDETLTGLFSGTLSSDSDVLVVRRASSNSTAMIDVDRSGSNANLRIEGEPSSAGCLFGGELCSGDLAVVSDCLKSRVFRAVTVSRGSGATGGGQIVHSQGLPAGGATGLPKNIDPKLEGQRFDPGAEIMAYNTFYYFVAPSSFQSGSGVEVLSLWRKRGERPATELVEGVERLRVEFGEGAPPDTYKNLGDVANWENVSAARIHLLVSSSATGVVPGDQTVVFAGQDITFSDGRLRQVFTSTVGMRSLLGER